MSGTLSVLLHLAGLAVHVIVQRRHRREGALLGKPYRILDVALDPGVDLLRLRRVHEILVLELVAERDDRIATAPFVNLFGGSIRTGIGHRVAAETIGHRLDERGT